MDKLSKSSSSQSAKTTGENESTIFKFPIRDHRIIDTSIDDINASLKIDQSLDCDHPNQKASCYEIDYDLHQLNLNDNPKPINHLNFNTSDSSNSVLSPVDRRHDRLSQNQEDNDVDDVKFHSFLSQNEYIEHDQLLAQMPLLVSNENNMSESIPLTTAPFSSKSSNCTSVAYGIDWSERAHPTSHCWFPYKFNDSSVPQLCAYVSCTNQTSTPDSLLLQCEACTLIMHAHHLNYSQTTNDNLIPPCRPSFIENLLADDGHNSSNYDQHFWSCVSVLPTPCMHCKCKSTFRNRFTRRVGTISMTHSSNFNDKNGSAINWLTTSSNAKRSQSSNDLVCLWCSRSYHRLCWEQCAAEDKNKKCDYGIFQHIIVRPQWMCRSKEHSSGFQARLPSSFVKNHSESKNFPYTPIICFVNQNSGGQYGAKIYRQLLRQLNPRQVFLLENDDTIINALGIYSLLPNIRICVLGGDGTAAWVLGRLAEIYPSNQNPPVSFCPLGTANDLSFILSWGNHYEPKLLFPSLIRIPQAPMISIDRWQVQIEQLIVSPSTSPKQQSSKASFKTSRPFQALLNPPKFVRETSRASYQNHRVLPNTYFINYMSFGLDAAIALEFHNKRIRDASKFSSPFKNKLMYLNQTCKYLNDFSRSSMWSLYPYIRLTCDGENLTDAIRHCHTLLIINIPAYASGTNPWGNSSSTVSVTSNAYHSPIIRKGGNSPSCTLTSSTNLSNSTPNIYEMTNLDKSSTKQATTSSVKTASSDRFGQQDFSDGKIEVVGLTAIRLAALHIGFHATRIAQCSRLRIELNSAMTAQMDGEPFYLLDPVAVNINYGGQALVLRNNSQ